MVAGVITKADLEVAATLKTALSALKDGMEAYSVALTGLHDEKVRSVIQKHIALRERFYKDLWDAVVERGGDPTDNSQLGGLIQRAWVEIKGQVKTGNQQALLKECLNIEGSTLRIYDKTMHMLLADDVWDVVEKQRRELKQCYDRLYTLQQ